MVGGTRTGARNPSAADKRPSWRSTEVNYLPVVIMWTAYCALHSFLISVGFTALMTRLLKNYSAFYRLFYVAISILLLIPLIRFTARFE